MPRLSLSCTPGNIRDSSDKLGVTSVRVTVREIATDSGIASPFLMDCAIDRAARADS